MLTVLNGFCMTERFDCVVCGEVCVDLALRTIDRSAPLEQMQTVRVDPIQPGVGGIVSNSGLAMAKLGLRVGAFGFVGNDAWESIIRKRFHDTGMDTTHLLRHPEEATSVTAVLVGEDGEHTFVYHPGASQCLDKATVLANLELFERTGFALFGYYALMPRLEDDLAEVLQIIQNTGCKTALDTAAGGGSLQPLDKILPFLDIYIPSYQEGLSQTGFTDPQDMIAVYRQYAPNALLGIKLGADGALVSPDVDRWLEVAPVTPPGPIVDTTGAGDSFYAGLIAGLCNGLELEMACKVAAAAGACCVTEVGGTNGIRSFADTLTLT